MTVLREVSEQIDAAIKETLPSKSGPINLAVNMVRHGLLPVRAAVALSLASGAAAVQLAAALELMNLAIHHLHHRLDDGERGGLGVGIAADILVGDYMSTGAFRLLVQCGDMAVMGAIADAVQRAAEAELIHETAPDGALAAAVRCAEPLGEAAGRAGAVLARYDARAVSLAASFGRHLCAAQALATLEPHPAAVAEAAAALALAQAHRAAGQLLVLTGNGRPLQLCAALAP